MPVRGGRLAAALALLLAGAGPAAAKPLSSVEEQALQRCEAVFKPGPVHLDPTQASVCLKVLARTGTLSGTMADERLDPDARARVNRVLMSASALKDLGDVFALQLSSGGLKAALSRRTFCDGALLALGLGPSPRPLLDWAARYRPAQAPLLGLIMRGWSWDAFPDVLRKRLLAEVKGGSRQDWDELCLDRRDFTLRGAAKRAAGDIMAIPAASLNGEALAQMRQAASAIRPYLQDEKGLVLDEHLRQVERFLTLRKRTAGVGKVKDQSKLDEYARRLGAGDLSLSEHMSFLSAIYGEDQGKGDASGTYEGSGKKRSSAAGYEDELAARLVPEMMDEIKGTRSGDRVLAFFKDKRYPAERREVRLRIRSMEGDFGAYGSEGISVSREAIEGWMRERGVSDAGDIVKDRRLRLELARFLAPTFVHEAVHQEQHAWLEKHGLPNRFYIEREYEAWSVGSVYILEKNASESARGGGDYLQSLHPLMVDRARRLYEDGLTGMRRFVAPAYSSMSSFDDFAAEDFEMSAAIDQELAARAKRPKEAEEKEEVFRLSDFTDSLAKYGYRRERIAEVSELKTAKLRRLRKESLSSYKEWGDWIDGSDSWVSDGLRKLKEGGK
jgi:hypothetical protein